MCVCVVYVCVSNYVSLCMDIYLCVFFNIVCCFTALVKKRVKIENDKNKNL